MDDETQRDVPTGTPDAESQGEPRGSHNRLEFFSQDEDRAADEHAGQEDQGDTTP